MKIIFSLCAISMMASVLCNCSPRIEIIENPKDSSIVQGESKSDNVGNASDLPKKEGNNNKK